MSVPRQKFALLVSVTGAMVVALDGTVLTIAQPRMQHTFGSSVSEIQWTSTAYLLSAASLLIFAGRLGDRYGHSRMLSLGAAGFGLASVGVMTAPGVGWVICWRAVQGAFGALMQPATLALLRSVYPSGELTRPVAVRTSAIGIAATAGPALGGWIVTDFGWRAIFALNVPLTLLIVGVSVAVPAPRPGRDAEQRFDLPGVVLLVAALAVLVETLASVPAHGWSGTPTLLGLAAVGVLFSVLVVHEKRARHPIVPRAVLRSIPVTASMGLLLAETGSLFGALFCVTFVLQDAMRLDPLQSGLRLLPLTVMMVVGAPVAGAAVRRFGPRAAAVSGSLLVAAGVAALTGLGPGSHWSAAAAPAALLGAGYATVMVTATGTVVGDAPPRYAGVVSGLKQSTMNIGPTVGIAIASTSLMIARSPAQPNGASVSRMGPAFLVLAGFALLGVLPALLLPPAVRRPLPLPLPESSGDTPEEAA